MSPTPSHFSWNFLAQNPLSLALYSNFTCLMAFVKNFLIVNFSSGEQTILEHKKKSGSWVRNLGMVWLTSWSNCVLNSANWEVKLVIFYVIFWLVVSDKFLLCLVSFMNSSCSFVLFASSSLSESVVERRFWTRSLRVAFLSSRVWILICWSVVVWRSWWFFSI